MTKRSVSGDTIEANCDPGGGERSDARAFKDSDAKKLIDPSVSLGEHPASIAQLVAWRTRYAALSRGLPLTNNDRRINALARNRHAGGRVWVIGNGPSIKHTDLSHLRDEVTIGTNSIFLNYENMGFYPSHYVVEDYLVAEDRVDDIVALGVLEDRRSGSATICGTVPDMPDVLG